MGTPAEGGCDWGNGGGVQGSARGEGAARQRKWELLWRTAAIGGMGEACRIARGMRESGARGLLSSARAVAKRGKGEGAQSASFAAWVHAGSSRPVREGGLAQRGQFVQAGDGIGGGDMLRGGRGASGTI